MNRLDRWINLAPALIASLIDITVTIVHQPKEYWEGNLDKANEGNPIGAIFMANHVSGLFLISGIEIILIMFLGYYLPNRISKYLLLFVLIAHSCATTTWIAGRYGFWSIMALALFNTLTYLIANDIINKRTKTNS
ncbi:hypothetical protein QQ008_26105 [Fulvivirgaceae bacterium BMA10]|uniref:DUF5658 domain-containing protein n=1 Tax=Splendidivirga corallicola TaxID=3051826 RepID=A0ABT8KVT0_9BACT|nr:hypothetical protein [Fulvivirgaceae bacterium BMA10]